MPAESVTAPAQSTRPDNGWLVYTTLGPEGLTQVIVTLVAVKPTGTIVYCRYGTSLSHTGCSTDRLMPGVGVALKKHGAFESVDWKPSASATVIVAVLGAVVPSGNVLVHRVDQGGGHRVGARTVEGRTHRNGHAGERLLQQRPRLLAGRRRPPASRTRTAPASAA